MKKYIRHQVVAMDESKIQNCVICGEEIANYQNAMWPSSQSAPQGWPAGSVFVLRGNPTIYATQLNHDEQFEDCKK